MKSGGDPASAHEWPRRKHRVRRGSSRPHVGNPWRRARCIAVTDAMSACARRLRWRIRFRRRRVSTDQHFRAANLHHHRSVQRESKVGQRRKSAGMPIVCAVLAPSRLAETVAERSGFGSCGYCARRV